MSQIENNTCKTCMQVMGSKLWVVNWEQILWVVHV